MEHIATVGSHVFYQFPGKGARMVASADEIRPSAEPAVTRSAAPAPEAADTAELMAVLERQAGPGREGERPADGKPVKLSAPVKGPEAKAIISGVSAKPAEADAPQGS